MINILCRLALTKIYFLHFTFYGVRIRCLLQIWKDSGSSADFQCTNSISCWSSPCYLSHFNVTRVSHFYSNPLPWSKAPGKISPTVESIVSKSQPLSFYFSSAFRYISFFLYMWVDIAPPQTAEFYWFCFCLACIKQTSSQSQTYLRYLDRGIKYYLLRWYWMVS